MRYVIFSEKEMLKQDKELVELHKKVIKTYLVQHSLKHSKIKKFFFLYDIYVTHRNIRNFFFRPANIFVQALLFKQLDLISDYVDKKKDGKRKRKRSTKD